MKKPALCLFLLWMGSVGASHAQTLTTLAVFDGTNGSMPLFSALVQGVDGNLYGTTPAGGTFGYGTVYKITTSGALTSLYSFCNQANCSAGYYPEAGLVQATDGNLYGTTNGGGGGSCGAVFRITLGGTLTALHQFDMRDGCKPYASLVEALGGELYGTTNSGGTDVPCGTVFKITTGGNLTTLDDFNGSDGCQPYAATTVVQAIDGSFYGTTSGGGAYSSGAIYRITAGGEITTVYNFSTADNPTGLIQAPDGNFYGVTLYGGNGNGSVYKLTPEGEFITLHNFEPGLDGNMPNDLVQGTDGNFYGTTYSGGPGSYGTIFKITPAGTLTTLYAFNGTNGGGGRYPGAALVQATDGNFYGTTYLAAPGQGGTVFKLSVGLGPFVKTVLHAARVGDAVEILGTNLTAATQVSFNGTQAAFTVVSSTLITATVPPGATTGKIEVTTPAGTLFRGGAFIVLP
jgi:uncharacterized repeat protein (TIGR03803 family)